MNWNNLSFRVIPARAILVIALVSLSSPVNASEAKPPSLMTGLKVIGCAAVVGGLVYLNHKSDRQAEELAAARLEMAQMRTEMSARETELEEKLTEAADRENQSNQLIAFLDLSQDRFAASLQDMKALLESPSISVSSENVWALDKFCSTFEDLQAAIRKENTLDLELAGPLRREALVKSASVRALIDMNLGSYLRVKSEVVKWRRVEELVAQIQKLEENLALIRSTVLELEPKVSSLEAAKPNSPEAVEARENLEKAKAVQGEIESELNALKGRQ